MLARVHVCVRICVCCMKCGLPDPIHVHDEGVTLTPAQGYLGLEGGKLAACLCASYVGGSANFAAVAAVSARRPNLPSS